MELGLNVVIWSRAGKESSLVLQGMSSLPQIHHWIWESWKGCVSCLTKESENMAMKKKQENVNDLSKNIAAPNAFSLFLQRRIITHFVFCLEKSPGRQQCDRKTDIHACRWTFSWRCHLPLLNVLMDKLHIIYENKYCRAETMKLPSQPASVLQEEKNKSIKPVFFHKPNLNKI